MTLTKRLKRKAGLKKPKATDSHFLKKIKTERPKHKLKIGEIILIGEIT